MKTGELTQKLAEMQKATEAGRLQWRVEIQTTEGNEEKYTIEEDGRGWTVDECYVSYRCQFRGADFGMITYEMIKVSGEEVRTVNYVFLPPSGIGLFSLHTLMEHSVEADAGLISQIHVLWTLLMDPARRGSGQTSLRIMEASVNIEEDM